MGPDPLREHLGVLCGHGGQVEGPAGRLRLPDPEIERTKSEREWADLGLQGRMVGLVTGAAGAPAEVWSPGPGPGPGPGRGSGTRLRPWTGSAPQRPAAGSFATAPAASAGGGAAPSLWPPPPPSLSTSTGGSRRPPAGPRPEMCEVGPPSSSLPRPQLRVLGTFLKARSKFSGAGCASQFFSLASIRRCCVLLCSLLLLCSCSSSWSVVCGPSEDGSSAGSALLKL